LRHAGTLHRIRRRDYADDLGGDARVVRVTLRRLGRSLGEFANFDEYSVAYREAGGEPDAVSPAALKAVPGQRDLGRHS
jgi:hypothetical protein